jgi:hypothetical protein
VKGFTVAEAIAIVLVVAFGAAIGVVVGHFVAKYW